MNGATLGTDRHGQANRAYSFDGQSNYIQSSVETSTGAWTFSVWIRDLGEMYETSFFSQHLILEAVILKDTTLGPMTGGFSVRFSRVAGAVLCF